VQAGIRLLIGIVLLANTPLGAAGVEFQVVTDADMATPVFAGRTTGGQGDIFWQGGAQDAELTDFPGVDADTIGRNTIGSSSITNATFGNDIVASYSVGETEYAGPIVFGTNTISNLERRIETLGFTAGLSADAQVLSALNTVNFSPDNTFSYSNLRTENSTHEFSANTRHGFFLAAGQDPATVFGDPALFANADPAVTQQGVIDHFNFIVENLVRSDWQVLTVELLEFTATEKPNADPSIGDFDGIVFGTTFVSFDPDAAPRPRSLFASILPISRSVQVGTPATVFAVLLNGGESQASGCRVSPSIGPLGAFNYTRTDPSTNALVSGSADIPFDLEPGAVQTLLVSITPNAELPATDVPLDFRCDSGEPATSVVGVNTLLFSASNSPVVDVVGLTTVVDLVAPEGSTGLFAVGSVNVGITDTVTVSLDTGGVPLPLNLNICQTDSTTGACSSAIGPEVSLNYPANSTATFAVFAEPTAPISINPAAHRIFIRFSDSAGSVRGATSTAVRTQ